MSLTEGACSMVDIRVNLIKAGERLRPYDKKKAVDLSYSIEKLGLLNPILVREIEKGKYRLIAGLHRLRAFEFLGWGHIPCVIIKRKDERDYELMEIDENLARSDLTQIERDSHMARRKEIYEYLHPNATKAAKVKVAAVKSKDDKLSFDSSFVEVQAARDGVSPSTIKEAVARAQVPNSQKLEGTALEGVRKRNALAKIHRRDPALAQDIINRAVAGEAPDVKSIAGGKTEGCWVSFTAEESASVKAFAAASSKTVPAVVIEALRSAGVLA